MAGTRSGLFSLKEFSYRRNVLKLAPDAFVVINGALSSRVLSPLQATRTQDIDIRGGISSVNVSCAVSPPGASRATIEVVAPIYKGLHEDYYITLPNGTRMPFFMPMMEVKIYMKGRYLEREYEYSPRYYPVFWGMITNVQENYSGGNYTFSITCEDFLVWWRHQKININPSIEDAFFGGAVRNRFPSIFEKMSAWEIIYSLFTDSFFIQHRENGSEAFFNFVYPKWSKIAQPPKSLTAIKDTYGPLSSSVISYWNERFGMGVRQQGSPSEIKSDLESIPLEMYGLRGPVKFETIKNKLLTFLNNDEGARGRQADRRANIDLDFALLDRVQPYGLFDLYGGMEENTILSKIELATAICEKTFMEFFVDTNGSIVFKPPFYNLDVASGQVKYYRIGPEDIINFNATFDSNAIINYLTVTGPLYQQLNLEAIGYHADFESIKRYGIRSEQVNVPFGMNSEQLKMIAVAEMNRRNGQAFSGNVSIPLRPEMRLGYPVYIEHIDAFYYVTGINHSFTFGSSATTDLSLQFRRDRMFENGNTGITDSKVGDVLYSCVLRDNEQEITDELKKIKTNTEEVLKQIDKRIEQEGVLEENVKADLDNKINEWKKQIALKEAGVFSGPGLMGLWKMDRAKISGTKAEEIINPDISSSVISNELIMITDKTVPFTDKSGYRHMGAFPYGANLILTKNGQMKDMTNFIDKVDFSVQTSLNCNGLPDDIPSSINTDIVISNQESTEKYADNSTDKSVTIKDYKKDVEKANSMQEDFKQQQNDQANPEININTQSKGGLAREDNLTEATSIQLNFSIGNVDVCEIDSNQE